MSFKRGKTPDKDAGSSGIAHDDDFRALFETHPIPMWVYDPETLRFLAVNDAATQLYGYERADFDRMTVLDIRPESEHERMLAAVQLRSDLDRSDRWQHMDVHGEIIEVVTHGRSVRFNDIDAILVIVIDRTEITRAHWQASDARSLLDSIISNLPVGVFVKDMEDDGRYILYNPTCGDLVGMAPSSIMGKPDEQVFGPDMAQQFRDQDRKVMDSGAVMVFEEDGLPTGPSRRNIYTWKRAIPTQDGSPARYLVGIAQDFTEQRLYEDRIAHVAMHDSLTGLPNRTFFTNHITALMSDSAAARPFALMYIDIDHFKDINDRLGHPTGDALLVEVGKRLTPLAGPHDLVARLGGDEFAFIFMLERDQELPPLLARRIMSAFSAPFQFEADQEHVYCSIGIAIADQDGDDVNTLLRNADLALYAAKAAGRSTFRFYESGMRLDAERRLALTLELRRAIVEDELLLHFQPLLCLADGEIRAFEALVRWQHPQRGLLGPGEFIPLAEDTGLIVGLGEWVLREACRAAANWPGEINVAVNLSSSQFTEVGLFETVVATLADTGLPPTRLQLEITESVPLASNGQNLHILHSLRDLGVTIAMDDFGTGYSSLSYLRSFPFDKIKMDRSFVAGMGKDPGSMAIIKAVIGLGAGFNLPTTAEGVETPEQLERLRDEGFTEIQGNLFAKPMPANKVGPFIRAHAVRTATARAAGPTG